MFSAACLNLPVGMRMHNIGRSVKSYTSLQASANLCRSSRGKAASARLLSSSSSTNLRRALSAASLDASKNLRGFATGTRFLGQSQAASVTDDASFSNATTDSQHDAAAAAAAAAGAAGRTVREDWMVNMGRHNDNAWLTGARPKEWWTGKHPSNCPGTSQQDGYLRSLAQPHLGRQTRASAQAYFDNGWCLTETLFAGLTGEEGFYRPPPHGLRHPQIFYYGHTPCLYVNKLRVAGVLDKAVDPYFESIFEVGVDEMLWDDMAKNDMVWPTVLEVKDYRQQVYDKVSEVIAEHSQLAPSPSSSSPFAPVINQASPLWSLYMGFEHERIHLETSSVLFRETPYHLVQIPEAWPGLHPTARLTEAEEQARAQASSSTSSICNDKNSSSSSRSRGVGGSSPHSARSAWSGFRPNAKPVEKTHYPANAMVGVAGKTVTLGKPDDFPSFGWDNEYGARRVEVASFATSTHLVSNGEFYHFVASGGYREEQFWSADGWAWRKHRNLKAPFFWQLDGPSGSHAYKLRTVFEVVDMPWSWPAEVTYHEAKAFAAWQSQREGMAPESPEAYRMLTEAEHHALRDQLPSGDRVLWCNGEDFAKVGAAPSSLDQVQLHGHQPTVAPAAAAATANNGNASAVTGAANANLAFGSCSPVDALPPSTSGHHDVSGNAWQWTEDHFNPLPGFGVHPFYDDFSAPCFDGRHHVIMGGSFASTGQEASMHARYHFRPHFLQHSGFRLVSQPQGECPSTLLAASFEEAQAAAEASAAEAAAVAQAAIKAAAAAAPATSSSAPKTKVSGTGVKISADSGNSGGGSGGETPVYETQALLDMYLGLHFPASKGPAGAEEVAPLLAHDKAPHHALRFPQRVAKMLIEHALTSPTSASSSNKKNGPTRALDVGCAVGGSSFELATSFDEVVGFDFSASFVRAAQAMQRGETLEFKVPIEGDYQAQVTATHEPNVSPEALARCSFHTGDACALLDRHQAQDPLLNGQFDGAVVANLLCRLPKPRAFLDGLAAVLKPGGVAVVVTPYSWLDEFTPQGEWLGGAKDATTGKHVAAKDVLEAEMNQRGLVKVHEEQVPLVIREHQRKYQYIVSEATVWRKKEQQE